MQVIRDLPSTEQIKDPAIRKLVRQRIDELGGDKFDAAKLGFMIVINPGDSADDIFDTTGVNVLANRVTGIRFGETGFVPSFEFVEAIGNYCYDLVYIVDDSGAGFELFIPIEVGIPAELLAMARLYAVSGMR